MTQKLVTRVELCGHVDLRGTPGSGPRLVLNIPGSKVFHFVGVHLPAIVGGGILSSSHPTSPMKGWTGEVGNVVVGLRAQKWIQQHPLSDFGTFPTSREN